MNHRSTSTHHRDRRQAAPSSTHSTSLHSVEPNITDLIHSRLFSDYQRRTEHQH